MADINVEHKDRSIWPWILGLLLLGLLIWGLIELLDDDDDDVAELPVATETAVAPVGTAEPIAQGPLCVAQVLAAPTTYVGQNLGECQMRVVEVVSDRGFWVEENGQRIFVVVNEGRPGVADTQGAAEAPDINAGQTIRVSQAMVMDNVANLAGPIDDQTRTLAQGQPWFLSIDEENVSMM